MKTDIEILIGCEESGIVTEQFRKRGLNAWSCDLLPTSGNLPQYHIQGDVLKVISEHPEIKMGIFFPPCTYLTYAGMRNWYDEGRAMKRVKAAEFFMQLYDAPVPLVCVENPQGIISKIFRKPDMTIHPYYFGEQEMKRTCLWLKGLPKLDYRLEDNLFGARTATDKPQPKNQHKQTKP